MTGKLFNNHLARICKEMNVARLEVLFWHLPNAINKNQERSFGG
jgi:hypothetical protein